MKQLLNLLSKGVFLFNRKNFSYNAPNSKMKITFDQRLKGMTKIDRDLFKTKINVPVVKVKKTDYSQVKKLLKKYTLESVVSCKKHQDLDTEDSFHDSHKYIFLDPDTFSKETLDETSKRDLIEVFKNDNAKSNPEDFIEIKEIQLEYEDFKFDDVIRAVIPDNLLNENVNVKGYSIIGHIAHFNLRDKILDYKYLIGL